ncbi:hypothetical protein ACFQH9_12850 [Pseudonocardia lutea]|uniref:DUF35 domain-containing protein n=1 Tax=Pseudonocardia lutea TaxID=2172015 RepID=A0ABW1I655_9PSEU
MTPRTMPRGRTPAIVGLGMTESGGGTVVSHAVAHRRDGSTRPLVIVELDEGPWWWSCVVGAQPHEVTTAARVRLDYERADGDSEAVPVFRLAAA